jgi:putative endonuclease
LSSCGTAFADAKDVSTGSSSVFMSAGGYVYIMTNRKGGTLYIGVTSDLVKRAWEHKEGVVAAFTKRYNLHTLVYYEIHGDIETTILYEKKLKNLYREKKIEIIERMNPEWRDLYADIV